MGLEVIYNSGLHLFFYGLGVVLANARLWVAVMYAYKYIGGGRGKLGLEVMYNLLYANNISCFYYSFIVIFFNLGKRL